MDSIDIPGVSISYGTGGLKATIQRSSVDLISKITYQLLKEFSPHDEIKSANTAQLTSGNLVAFRDLLYDTYLKNNAAFELLNSCKNDLEQVTVKHEKLSRSIFKFFYKKRISSLEDLKISFEKDHARYQGELEKMRIILKIDAEDEFNNQYDIIRQAFNILTESHKKWDVTSSKQTNRIVERTSATSIITRAEIRIEFRQLGLLHCDESPMVLQNMNGGDLYLFPGFLIYHNSDKKFALIDYTDLKVDFHPVKFIEDKEVPEDSEIIGQTWSKVNKDGSPDRRFSNNRRLPIVQYGDVHFTSSTGLNEVFCFSNHNAARIFGAAFNNYITALKQAKALLEKFKS